MLRAIIDLHKISQKPCHFWLRIRNHFSARFLNNMSEHIVTEIIMLRTVTNRGSSAVPKAPRVALRARRPTPRERSTAHPLAAACRRQRAWHARADKRVAQQLGATWLLLPWRTDLACGIASKTGLCTTSERRAGLPPLAKFLKKVCHFWLPNRNHVLRSLRHFWLRILNHFLANFFNRVEKTFAISGYEIVTTFCAASAISG